MIKCPYCGGKPEWVENSEVYGKRFGKSYMIWLCRPCDAYVGCHNNTKMPLGTLAKKKLRDLRHRCHELFDARWFDNSERSKEYAWLADRMHVDEIHIAQCDENMCREIIEILEEDLE